jgi:hypothetical protein
MAVLVRSIFSNVSQARCHRQSIQLKATETPLRMDYSMAIIAGYSSP